MSLRNFLTGIEKESRKGRGYLFCWPSCDEGDLFYANGQAYTLEDLNQLEDKGWVVVKFGKVH